MGIFSYIQGQLTPQSVVQSGRNSNSSKISCMLSLPVTMETSGRIWSNVEQIQALVYVIITCKHEKDLIKNSGENRRHRFSHYKPMGIFFRHSRAGNSAVGGPIRPKFELVRDLMHVTITCKYKKERMKNNREKVETPFFLT